MPNVRIRALKGFSSPRFAAGPGEEIEVEAATADDLVRAGLAEYVAAKAEKKVVERAVRGRGERRKK
ncbi:MAG: hypothetical protein D6782_02915 [Alphaproteobacteria bacterium]|nr:MAG: hypothetical protein D6782_02915 [Alphaproteobacteria bacterium]